MIDKDYIKKTFGYLDNLRIEGWIWEFVRRNREFRTIYESIRDLSSTVQVSRLSNNNMFRIEMPLVLANKLTDMEDKFGLRPNIEMKSSLVPSQFTTIDKTLFIVYDLRDWYFAIMRDGRRVQRSTGTSKKLAQTIYENALSDIIKKKWFRNEKARTMTFRELWEPYRRKYEKLRDETSSKRLLPYFGDMKLAEIAPEDIEDYVLDRQEFPLPPADTTIYQEFSLIRRTDPGTYVT